MFYLKHAFSTYLSFLIFIFIKIEEIMESMKIIINTFSPIKELIIASKEKTITSVKHKLICPTADNRSLSSFDSFIMYLFYTKKGKEKLF